MPDQETRYPDSTDDVMKASFTGVSNVLREGGNVGQQQQLPAGAGQSQQQERGRTEEAGQGAAGGGVGGSQHQPSSFVPSRRRRGHHFQEQERFDRNLAAECYGADCVRRR